MAAYVVLVPLLRFPWIALMQSRPLPHQALQVGWLVALMRVLSCNVAVRVFFDKDLRRQADRIAELSQTNVRLQAEYDRWALLGCIV